MSRSGIFSSLFASAPVPAAVEITARRINGVSLAGYAFPPAIAAHVSEPLPDGLVTPSLNAANVHDHEALTAAVRAAVDRLSPRRRRIALVLPDTVAKVSLLRFEKVPSRISELDQLIRWQMRKAAPFRIEDAQVGWTLSGPAAGGGDEYLVVLSRRDVIESYERACEAAGVHAGLVDIATLNVVNAALALRDSPVAGDWLLIHIAPGYATIVVVRAGRLIFFRNRQTEGSGSPDLTDLVHQTAMYHEDRLGGGGFSRVLLAGASLDGIEEMGGPRRQIEERLGVGVESVDLRGAVTFRDRLQPSQQLIDNLAPAVGILLRERSAGRHTAERLAG